jgi:hypothetical protein
MKQIDLSIYSVKEINIYEILIINGGSEATESWTRSIGAGLHYVWSALKSCDAHYTPYYIN